MHIEEKSKKKTIALNVFAIALMIVSIVFIYYIDNWKEDYVTKYGPDRKVECNLRSEEPPVSSVITFNSHKSLSTFQSQEICKQLFESIKRVSEELKK